jgi:hypothetical protein
MAEMMPVKEDEIVSSGENRVVASSVPIPIAEMSIA